MAYETRPRNLLLLGRPIMLSDDRAKYSRQPHEYFRIKYATQQINLFSLQILSEEV